MDQSIRLNDTLLQNILWRVPVSGDRKYAGVCRRWRFISYSCHTCLKVPAKPTGNKLTEEALLRHLSLFRGIRKLELMPGSVKRISDRFLELVADLWGENLVTLDVQGVGSSITQDGVSSFLAASSNLRCLRLGIMGEPFPLDIPLLMGGKPLGLISLEIHCIRLLPPSIAELTSLRRLTLQRCPFKMLPRHLSRMPSLQHLDVSFCPLLQELPPELPSSLRYIRLANLPNLSSLPRSLPRLPSLNHIQLHACPALLHLPGSLPRCKLDLSQCPQLQQFDRASSKKSSGASSALPSALNIGLKHIGGPGSWDPWPRLLLPLVPKAAARPSSSRSSGSQAQGEKCGSPSTAADRTVRGATAAQAWLEIHRRSIRRSSRRSSRSSAGGPRVSWGAETYFPSVEEEPKSIDKQDTESVRALPAEEQTCTQSQLKMSSSISEAAASMAGVDLLLSSSGAMLSIVPRVHNNQSHEHCLPLLPLLHSGRVLWGGGMRKSPHTEGVPLRRSRTWGPKDADVWTVVQDTKATHHGPKLERWPSFRKSSRLGLQTAASLSILESTFDSHLAAVPEESTSPVESTCPGALDQQGAQPKTQSSRRPSLRTQILRFSTAKVTPLGPPQA